MQKTSKFFQIVLLIFFALFSIFFIAFDTLGGIFGMNEINSDNMVTIMLVGFIIFLVSWLFSYLSINNLSDKLNKKEIEMNKLKAKLYDLQEEKKTSIAPEKKIEASEPKNESKES